MRKAMNKNLLTILLLVCVFSTSRGASTPNGMNYADKKQYSVSGTLWSGNGSRVLVKKKNNIEFLFSKIGEPEKLAAIGPFVKGASSIFCLEYNLDFEHGKPFVLNFLTWICNYINTDGVIFDAGLTIDRSLYWALEGLDSGKNVDTYLLLISEDGKIVLRKRVLNAGLTKIVHNGVGFEINVRMARGIDLIN